MHQNFSMFPNLLYIDGVLLKINTKKKTVIMKFWMIFREYHPEFYCESVEPNPPFLEDISVIFNL